MPAPPGTVQASEAPGKISRPMVKWIATEEVKYFLYCPTHFTMIPLCPQPPSPLPGVKKRQSSSHEEVRPLCTDTCCPLKLASHPFSLSLFLLSQAAVTLTSQS